MLLFSGQVVSDYLLTMDCSTPGSSVLHKILEFAQIYVHPVSDAIQPLSSAATGQPPSARAELHPHILTHRLHFQ